MRKVSIIVLLLIIAIGYGFAHEGHDIIKEMALHSEDEEKLESLSDKLIWTIRKLDDDDFTRQALLTKGMTNNVQARYLPRFKDDIDFNARVLMNVKEEERRLGSNAFKEALERIDDNELLDKIVRSNTHHMIRSWAMRRITDQNLLFQILQDRVMEDEFIIAGKIKDKAIIKDAMVVVTEPLAKRVLLENLGDEELAFQFFLEQIEVDPTFRFDTLFYVIEDKEKLEYIIHNRTPALFDISYAVKKYYDLDGIKDLSDKEFVDAVTSKDHIKVLYSYYENAKYEQNMAKLLKRRLIPWHWILVGAVVILFYPLLQFSKMLLKELGFGKKKKKSKRKGRNIRTSRNTQSPRPAENMTDWGVQTASQDYKSTDDLFGDLVGSRLSEHMDTLFYGAEGSDSEQSVEAESSNESALFGRLSDKNKAVEYLKNLGERAKDEGVYSIWSWTDGRNGKTFYQFLSDVRSSNQFEFDSPDYVKNKTMLYEQGVMRTAGRELADGPDWADKDNKKYEALKGGELEEQLLEAVEAEDAAKVEEMLTSGANANTIGGRTGSSPVLLLAAKTGNIPIVDLLLDKGADINYQDSEGFALIAKAAYDPTEKTAEMLRHLKDRGADIYAETVRGIPAVQLIKTYFKDFDF